MKNFLAAVSGIAAVVLILSVGVAFVGVYIAIWGDNALGGRIVATGMATIVLSICIGLPSHEFSKEEDA